MRACVAAGPAAVLSPTVARVRQLRVAFGPNTGWGSWQWIGAEMQGALADSFLTSAFGISEVPRADVLVFIKFLPDLELLRQVARRSAVLYCPVDVYGSQREIYLDRRRLTLCRLIVVHCRRLAHLFAPFAPTVYLDHHVRFIADPVTPQRDASFVLWTGSHSNLGPLVEWTTRVPLPAPLKVLTDLPASIVHAGDLGFRSDHAVTIEAWSENRHRELLRAAWLAIDVKGNDFRQRHKPPAKAIDFLASGLPLAMNLDSSSAEHLAEMGFEVCSPDDTAKWTSRAYFQETLQFGLALRELLARERVALRWRRLISELALEPGQRTGQPASACTGEAT